MREQIRLKIASRCLTFCQEMGEFQKSLTAYKLFGVTRTASSAWVFIAQLVEHCSANAEATDSNPVEAPKNFFFGRFRNCLNCDSLRCSHTHFTMRIILNKQCVSLHRWYHRPGGTRLKYDDLWEHQQRD